MPKAAKIRQKTMNKLLYLHGFNSSADSKKAQQFKAFINKRYGAEFLICPDLADEPNDAITQLENILKHESVGGIIGSSLGGFYALWLANTFNKKAVLVNPAIQPWKLLTDHLGIQTNYYRDHQWLLTQNIVDQLNQYEVSSLTPPKNIRIYLQTDDDTCPYQQAVNAYPDCEFIIEQGGSHSFDGFERHFDSIVNFFS
jgi:uncharacterized protein